MGNEKGHLLYTVALGMLVVLAMLMFTSVMLHSNSKDRAQQWAYHGMAMNMAEAGLIETLSWFRLNPNVSNLDGDWRVMQLSYYCDEPSHRENQEITDYNVPHFDAGTCSQGHAWTAPATLNPFIGIVKEIKLTDDLYGRFEVWDDDMQDVTLSGDLWKVRSIGMLIQKDNADSNFHSVLGNELLGYTGDEVPQEVIDDVGEVELLTSVVMATEFRKLNISLPVAAMLISPNHASWISLNDKVRLVGPGNQGSAIQYLPSTGAASTSGAVEIQGFNENRTDHPGQDFSCDMFDIFGVDKKTLGALADISVDTYLDLPSPLPEMKLVYVQGSANFDSTSPLVGSGILFVDGDLTLIESGHSWSGIICTTGRFSNAAISTVYGAVVAGLEYADDSTLTAFSIGGLGADYAEFYYDPGVIDEVSTQLGVYRMARSPYVLNQESINADGTVDIIPLSWLYGFDTEGNKNKNRAARRWLPAEYP